MFEGLALPNETSTDGQSLSLLPGARTAGGHFNQLWRFHLDHVHRAHRHAAGGSHRHSSEYRPATIIIVECSGADQKLSSRLVVLSSAAVLTVYGAGYFRICSGHPRFSRQTARQTSAAPLVAGAVPPPAARNHQLGSAASQTAKSRKAAAPRDPSTSASPGRVRVHQTSSRRPENPATPTAMVHRPAPMSSRPPTLRADYRASSVPRTEPFWAGAAAATAISRLRW